MCSETSCNNVALNKVSTISRRWEPSGSAGLTVQSSIMGFSESSTWPEKTEAGLLARAHHILAMPRSLPLSQSERGRHSVI